VRTQKYPLFTLLEPKKFHTAFCFLVALHQLSEVAFLDILRYACTTWCTIVILLEVLQVELCESDLCCYRGHLGFIRQLASPLVTMVVAPAEPYCGDRQRTQCPCTRLQHKCPFSPLKCQHKQPCARMRRTTRPCNAKVRHCDV